MELPEWVSIFIATLIGFLMIVVFALLLSGVFSNTANVAMCQAASRARHDFENLCIQTIGGEFCGSDFSRYIMPTSPLRSTPLFGCASQFIPMGATSTETLSKELAKQVADCWTKYGEGKLNVLWITGENPAECAVISATLSERLDAKTFTEVLESTNYTKKLDCEGMDPECCEETYGKDYECSRSDPQFCLKLEENPWICETKTPFYQRCDTGFQATQIERDYYGCIQELADFVCPQYYEYDPALQKCKDSLQTAACTTDDDCYEDATCESGICVTPITPPDVFQYYDPYTLGGCPENYGYNSDLQKCRDLLQTDVCPDPYVCVSPAVCEDGKCVIDYTEPYVVPESDPTCKFCKNSEDFSILPRTCTLQEYTKCEKMLTYADFVKPGHKTIYSFNSPDGKTIVEEDDEEIGVTNRIDIYVYFIDSFTGSRKDEVVGILPEYCSSQSFVDSCGGCPSCLRAAEVGGIIGLGLAPGAIKTGATVVYDVYQYFFLGSPTTLTGLPSCAVCLGNTLSRLSADLVACTDKIMICFKEEVT